MNKNLMKTCTKCNIEKHLDEFHKDNRRKNGRQPKCKICQNETTGKYRREHPEQFRRYQEKHRKEIAENRRKRYERTGRQQQGSKPMNENKTCSLYLGIVIAERLIKHMFNDVQVMPRGNPKFDFICNKGKKIDVKSGCITLNNGKYSSWSFHIDRNTIADYFILVAFDNRTDLNPLHLWMIPGNILNHQGSANVSPSTIHKWDKYKKDINDAQLCCAELKKSNQ